MSDDRDAIPRQVAHELTAGTIALRDAERIDRDLRDLRAFVETRLAGGAQSFVELRAQLERVKEQMDGKVSSRHQTIKDEASEIEQRLDEKIRGVGDSVADLAERVAPRATTLKLIGWAAALLFAIASPIIVAARAPDRAEIRELDNRIRALELRVTEINARLGARGTP